MQAITQRAIELLKQMIAAPSISGNEKEVSDIVFNFLKDNGYSPTQIVTIIKSLFVTNNLRKE